MRLIILTAVMLVLAGCVTTPALITAPEDDSAALIGDLFNAGCDIASYERSERFKSTKVTCK